MAAADPTVDVNAVTNPINYEGQKITDLVKITGPVSYTTGGFSLAGGSNGIPIGTFQRVTFDGVFKKTDDSAVLLPMWNPATQKVLLYVPNTGAQVANGVDVSTYIAYAKVVGY